MHGTFILSKHQLTLLWYTYRTVVTLLIYTNIHLRRLIPHNDIQRIVASWGTPNSPTVDEARWPTDFSRDIIPIPCHSHNDYWRRVPLFDALAAGCTSIEADVWLTSNGLLVGHDPRSLTLQRTLASLYIDPLTKSLSHQNNNSTVLTNDSTGTSPRGIFDTQPSTPITLLIDIKTDGPKTFGAVLASLEPLRSQGWLTHFNGTTVIPGLVTVVGSGNTPFDLLATNTSYRDLFFDAPLDALWGEDTPTNSTIYTSENSYYASVSFEKSIGKLWKGIMTPMQIRTVQGQIQAASERGLKARYWDTPSWPRGQRGHVWDVLTRENVGILNVDDLEAASRYSW